MTTTDSRKRTKNTNNGKQAADVHTKVSNLKDELQQAFQERDSVVIGVLVSVLAQEHCVLLGPPGTAKSLLPRVLSQAIDSTFFEHLMTRYTEPNEVFGPIDLQAWSNKGTYSRRTAGFFPEAEVAFLDEIFKANSSILNALLAAVNERVFHDDGQAKPLPLQSVIAASNEMPESAELEALFDRFMLRYEVGYVRAPDAFKAIIAGTKPEQLVTTKLSKKELQQAQADAMALPLASDVVDTLFELRTKLEQEGIVASDRRWRKLVNVLRAYAYLLGDTQVETIHFDILAEGLWREPQERSKIAGIIAKMASPALAEVQEIHDAIMEQVQGLPATGEVRSQGSAVVAELKKAVKKIDAKLGEVDKSSTVGQRIVEMRKRLKTQQNEIANRIAKELGLGDDEDEDEG